MSSERINTHLRTLFLNLNIDVTDDALQKFSELGVETPDDLKYLEKSDLSFMKPIHIRKFLEIVKKGESTIEISETAGIQNSHLASAKPQPQSKEIQVQSHLQSWIDFDLKPVFLRMPQLLPDFEAGKRINPDLRRHFVREVVNEVRKVSIHCGKKEFETIAQKITRKYPNTFEDRIGDIRIGSGHDSVLKQLLSRNENLNRSTAQSPRHESKKGKEGKEVVCKRKSVSERDTYGCVNWSPVLSNEDMEEQENIRKELIDMHSTMERDMEKVYENMNSSYGLLRKMINEGKPIEQLISEWPFLSQACVLLKHCEKLIGLNVPANVENAYLQKGPVLLRYLRSKTELSQFLGQLETEKNNDNYQAILPAVLLSIQKCLGEEMTSLMFSVDEMAFNEEIEQANTESWPRLAMLGETNLAAKHFALIVDGNVLLRSSSYLEAVSLMFSAYYIFNIQYPDKAAATLEFIQRSFVGINPEHGQKSVKRKRTSSIHSKVLSLINAIADFQWMPK